MAPRRTEARTTETRTTWHGARHGARAVIAVLALYALVLQGFLGGLMPPAGPGGVHCAPVAAGEHPDRTSHDHAACCVAAHVLASALPSRDGAVALGQPRPPAAAIAWTMSTGFSPRAPPHTRPHPRGPPAA